MAYSIVAIVSTVLVVAFVDGAVLTASAGQCKDSYDCAQGSCCRDSSGTVLTRQEGGFMHFPQPPSGNGGTCSTQLAQMGDNCDSNCQCGAGMECYRPMSGMCCPPMRCYNATYVQQQKAYWANCMADPQCHLPP